MSISGDFQPHTAVRSPTVKRSSGESPEELYERAAHALRMPPVAEWDTFPFDGELRIRTLEPPAPTQLLGTP